jgi:hypothetical protein
MSTLDVARAELGLVVLYLNKAEARDKICRAIQYGSKYLSNGEPGTAQNVDKTTSLARKVFRLFKFVNDLHALISPTAAGTPLPLVLLGKVQKGLLTESFLFVYDILFVTSNHNAFLSLKMHCCLVSCFSTKLSGSIGRAFIRKKNVRS